MSEQHSETGESSAVLETVESTDSLEARTLNVRQGAFAIATTQDTLNRLRTGNLGPCVAFYGINRRAGVTFMSHVDGNLCGFRALEDRLSSATNGDLESFALYATTNYTMTARLGLPRSCRRGVSLVALMVVAGVDSRRRRLWFRKPSADLHLRPASLRHMARQALHAVAVLRTRRGQS